MHPCSGAFDIKSSFRACKKRASDLPICRFIRTLGVLFTKTILYSQLVSCVLGAAFDMFLKDG